MAEHLIHTYGTSALRVIELGEQNQKSKSMGTNERIHPDYPFLKSEIAYATRHEMAVKPTDILCRRVPIAFLNKEAAEQILPEVAEIMGKEHKWSSATKT